ncbi:CU044_5270 family protein [Streptomyces coffeae]|uniref:CU044_5270 family protein n=1 Tax=Streptomyces coffeae TaxID=621382 RepID=A0ABS1NF20_9ACTN|nr:CU044_5270 family protein [Streptomyces coffeae]MBL1098673.1 CU044_5270 family protein [Streptomyces coffeae]
MTDELELLRDADPVSAETGPWRDRPLDARAELLLRRLGLQRRRRTVRLRLLAIEAVAAAAVLALALTVPGGGAPAATAADLVAAPRPLVAHASRADVPLAEIARRARAAAKETPGKSVMGSHVQSWSMGMEPGKDTVTTPVESLTRWNADGSGSRLEVATDPRYPGRPVIDDSTPPRTVHDGKVLRRENYPKGTYGANQDYFEAPPTGVAELRSYLAAWLPGADKDPASLLSAVQSFQSVWTLGPRQIADIATLLSRVEGMRPAGRVTDRLGREGQGFRLSAESGGRYLVVLDPDDGRLLDLELTATRAEPEYRLKAGDVLFYTAWRG